MNPYRDAALVAASLAALRVVYAEHDARREAAIATLEEATPICVALAQRIDELEAKLDSLRPQYPARLPAKSHAGTKAAPPSANNMDGARSVGAAAGTLGGVAMSAPIEWPCIECYGALEYVGLRYGGRIPTLVCTGCGKAFSANEYGAAMDQAAKRMAETSLARRSA